MEAQRTNGRTRLIWMAFSLAAIFNIMFLASSCSDSQPPCEKVCAFVFECWGDDGYQTCQETCPAIADQVKSEGYDVQAVTDCVLANASCMDFTSVAAMEAEIRACAEAQDIPDGGPPPVDGGIPQGHITTIEGCMLIGHAQCNRRDDCLAERPPDVAHCRRDITESCQHETGTIAESEVEECVAQIESASCDDLFDGSGNPLLPEDCPEL